MSMLNDNITGKQYDILRGLYKVNKETKKAARPYQIGDVFGRNHRDSPKWVCSGMQWLIHYGLAMKVGRGLYVITRNGIFFLINHKNGL